MRKLVRFFSLAFSLVYGGAVCAQQTLPGEPGEGEIWVNGRVFTSLQQAFEFVPVAGIIRIGPGVFKQGGILKAKHRVHISGTDDTVFDGVAVNGKAAFVIASNDVTMENIACRNIAVRDKNGACVRFEGTNLTLKNVHFSNSENGILAGERSGKILIEDSIFEANGKDGFSHGMYINGGELTIRRTKVIGSKSEGHGIKSRAARTIIENSIVASLDGNDSRLIDVPNGGVAIIRNSLLVEGPNTVNWQLFSFGVEGSRYEANAFKLERNVIVTDRKGGSILIMVSDDMPKPIATNNIVVGDFGDFEWPINNFFYESREELNWPEAPTLPEWDLTAK